MGKPWRLFTEMHVGFAVASVPGGRGRHRISGWELRADRDGGQRGVFVTVISISAT